MRKWEIIHFSPKGATALDPMRDFEIEAALVSGELNWIDFARSLTSGGDWKRLYQLDEFNVRIPQMPELRELYAKQAKMKPGKSRSSKGTAPELSSPSMLKNLEFLELTQSALKKPSTPWFIQYGGTEFGPFNVAEVEKILESGRLSGGDLYFWSSALPNWVPLSAIPQFAKRVSDPAALENKRPKKAELELVVVHSVSREMRGPHRVPLVATVSQGKKGMILGVCEDVSRSGLQACVDANLRLQIHETYRLWVQPLGTIGLDGFWVDAELSWINPATRRAGFRFKEIDAKARDQLERYLDESKRRSASN